MNSNIYRGMPVMVLAILIGTAAAQAPSIAKKKQPMDDGPIWWPYGAATTSEFCGVCHQAIYQEHALGFGADLSWKPMVLKSLDESPFSLPPEMPATATAHHAAGVDPWPIRARQYENGGQPCNVCHFPEAFNLPDINTPMLDAPVGRSLVRESVGVTCASCHMTPDGKIRGSYGAPAPHESVADPNMRTSAACAYCHSKGPRVVGKQTQTFYEWRDDFYNAGLGKQHCQDCHMQRTVRPLAELYDVPPRLVGRHLWTGDHSATRIGEGLTVALSQAASDAPNAGQLSIHVINVAAGHSVPTGSNRRAIYLTAEVLSGTTVVTSKEWMFAPWYGNRPDDRSFLQADQNLPDAIAASQADAQGPHEPPVRAGEDRVLSWTPTLPGGSYTFRATLTYDLNRYNDRAFKDDQTQIYQTSIPLNVSAN
jgi:hypothetical protein